jgi:hypothetical protein
MRIKTDQVQKWSIDNGLDQLETILITCSSSPMVSRIEFDHDRELKDTGTSIL